MEKYSLLLASSAVLIASYAQLLMKASACVKAESGFLSKFLNIRVILAYFMMLLSSLVNVFSLRYLQLKFIPVVEATGYIWVPVLSIIFIHEKPSKNNVIGCIIIIIGMCIFTFGNQI